MEAIDRASIHSDPQQAFQALRSIYSAVQQSKQTVPGNLFERIISAAAAIPEPYHQTECLKEVVQELALAGKTRPAAQALHFMRFNPTYDCFNIVKDLANRGLIRHAQELLQHFAATAHHPTWYTWLEHMVPADEHQPSSLALFESWQKEFPNPSAEDYERYFEHTQIRRHQTDWAEALRAIAHALVLAGRSEEAKAVAATMPDFEVRQRTLAEIDALQAQRGQSGIEDHEIVQTTGFDDALARDHALPDVQRRIVDYQELFTYTDITPKQFIMILEQELIIVRLIVSPETRLYLLGLIALYLARLGDSRAERVLNESMSLSLAITQIGQPKLYTVILAGIQTLAQGLLLNPSNDPAAPVNVDRVKNWIALGQRTLIEIRAYVERAPAGARLDSLASDIAAAMLELFASLKALDIQPLESSLLDAALCDIAITLLKYVDSPRLELVTKTLTIALGLKSSNIFTVIIRSRNLQIKALPILAALDGERTQRLFTAVLASVLQDSDSLIERIDTLVQTAKILELRDANQSDRIIEWIVENYTRQDCDERTIRDVITILARNGYASQALGLIDAIRRHEGIRLDALTEIAANLALADDQQAEAIFEQVLTMARAIGYPYGQASALNAIAAAYARAGDSRTAELLADEALVAARMPDNTSESGAEASLAQAHAEAEIVGTLVSLNQIDKAMTLADEIVRHATHYRAAAHTAIIDGLVHAQRFEEAMQLANAIEYNQFQERTNAQRRLAHTLIAHERIADALMLLSNVEPEEFLNTCLALLPALYRQQPGLEKSAAQEIARIVGWEFPEWRSVAVTIAE
ncbi:MAG: hypothetical protein HGA19_03230 [Oscillochloris sp.]|nr:hypothetical protein [Oscillochloris sp.]